MIHASDKHPGVKVEGVKVNTGSVIKVIVEINVGELFDFNIYLLQVLVLAI